MADAPRLPFDADQAAFDRWREAMTARADDPDDDLLPIDVNDAVMVFAASRALGQAHPDKVPALIEHGPDAYQRASEDLGMFMGITYLAEKAGIDGEEARQAMLGLFKSDG